MNAMELGSLWLQARAVHPDDQARQNESFMAALGVFAELATAKERTARIEAQQRLADAQELAAKSGLAHRMAVQRCVQAAVAEAVAAEREACAALMSSMMAKSRNHLFRSALKCAEGEIRARGTP